MVWCWQIIYNVDLQKIIRVNHSSTIDVIGTSINICSIDVLKSAPVMQRTSSHELLKERSCHKFTFFFSHFFVVWIVDSFRFIHFLDLDGFIHEASMPRDRLLLEAHAAESSKFGHRLECGAARRDVIGWVYNTMCSKTCSQRFRMFGAHHHSFSGVMRTICWKAQEVQADMHNRTHQTDESQHTQWLDVAGFFRCKLNEHSCRSSAVAEVASEEAWVSWKRDLWTEANSAVKVSVIGSKILGY